MKTKISSKNPFVVGLDPFSNERYKFLWEMLSNLKKGVHLDYGAYDGGVIKQIASTQIIEQGVGVDVNSEIVEEYAEKMPSNVSLVKIDKSSSLPYPDKYFDSVSILDVIEHIHDQQSLLNELHRVLKDEGVIVATVPKKHVFSFLDMGNFKFIFPRIHRGFYEFKYSKDEYLKRYVDCENGLFGDIEKEKMWHQHFSEEEISSLLRECGFQVVLLDGAGLFMRPIRLLRYFSFKPLSNLLDYAMTLDSKLFEQTHLFCLARKS
jgi:ubiquinone/menaquinone biosynthesis C-methylase UbiE